MCVFSMLSVFLIPPSHLAVFCIFGVYVCPSACPCVCTDAFVCSFIGVCMHAGILPCMCVDVRLFVIDGALSPFPQLGPAA